jgi:hypothetical protein
MVRKTIVTALMAAMALAAAVAIGGIVPANAGTGGPDDDGNKIIQGTVVLTAGQTVSGTAFDFGSHSALSVVPDIEAQSGDCVVRVTRHDYVMINNLTGVKWEMKNVGTGICGLVVRAAWID